MQKPKSKDVERVPRKRPLPVSRRHKHSDEDNDDDDEDDSEVEQINKNDDDAESDEHSSEYERIKELSQKQEQELKQNPKHCKVHIKKDNMRCSVCMNPETGAHSESCSYSSTPPEKKYAYTKERNYNSKDNEPLEEGDEQEEEADDEDEEDGTANGTSKSEKLVSTTTTTTTSTTTARPYRRRIHVRPTNEPTVSPAIFSPPTRAHPIRAQPVRRQVRGRRPETTNSNGTRYSSAYRAEESRINRQVIGLDPFLYGSSSDDSNSEKSAKLTDSLGHSYDEYFAHVFPESKSSKLTAAKRDDDSEAPDDDVEFLPNYDTKQNVEKVLADFRKKDWSKCDKEKKGDLTCYQCKDERGVRHEECIFVSTPQTSRLTYLETKKYKNPNDRRTEDDDEDSSDNGSEVVTDRSIVAESNSEKKKLKRKLVLRKRKAKLTKINNNVGPVTYAPKPEDVTEHQAANEKQTIKRTVSYRIENSNEQVPAESRVMVYEHKMSKVL